MYYILRASSTIRDQSQDHCDNPSCADLMSTRRGWNSRIETARLMASLDSQMRDKLQCNNASVPFAQNRDKVRRAPFALRASSSSYYSHSLLCWFTKAKSQGPKYEQPHSQKQRPSRMQKFSCPDCIWGLGNWCGKDRFKANSNICRTLLRVSWLAAVSVPGLAAVDLKMQSVS